MTASAAGRNVLLPNPVVLRPNPFVPPYDTSVVDAISAKDSVLASTINIDANPFFDSNGHILITHPPDVLMETLEQTGCKWAWRRRWHAKSALDDDCDAIIAPFLRSGPGASLGLLAACVSSGLFDVWDNTFGPDHYEEDALMTRVDVLSEAKDGSLKPDLRGYCGWEVDAPHLLSPLAPFGTPYNTSELTRIAERGGNALPYAYHVAGEWSFQYVLGDHDMSYTEEQVLQRAQYAAQLWLVLGEITVCTDPMAGCVQGTKPLDEWPERQATLARQLRLENKTAFAVDLLMHGVHGVSWSVIGRLKTMGVPRFEKPGAALVETVSLLCNDTASLNFADSWMFCIHGVGHALAWYVSKAQVSITEAVATCAEFRDDNRLVRECQEGFFHEIERASLWEMPSLNQSFLPVGVKAPCDHVDLVGTPESVGACYRVLTVSGKPQFPVHRVAPPEWWDTLTMLSGATPNAAVLRLTSAGTAAWDDTVGMCQGPVPGVYSDMHIAACLAASVAWMVATAKLHLTAVSGDKSVVWPRVAGLRGAPDPRRASTSTAAAASSNATRVPRLASQLLSMPWKADDSWDLLLCELSTATLPASSAFHIWAACVQSITKGETYIDPWQPSVSGMAETGGVMACQQRWNRTRFESGTEPQLHFVEELCINNSLSHGFSFQPLLQWAQLSSHYATTVRSLSH